MNKKIKKAFTLVELIVVIAVLAILAGVGVVGYSVFTNRSKLSHDQTNLIQFNKLLSGNETALDRVNNPYEVKELLKENNYGDNFIPESNNSYFYWNRLDNTIYLVKENKTTWDVVYPEESSNLVENQHKEDTTGKNFYRLDKEYYLISCDLTGLTGADDNVYSIEKDGTQTLTFYEESNYTLPNSVSIDGATIASWSSETGQLSIINPTQNVEISAEGIKFVGNLNVQYTNKTVNGNNYKIAKFAGYEWLVLKEESEYITLLAIDNWTSGCYDTEKIDYEYSDLDEYMVSLTSKGGSLFEYKEYLYDYLINDDHTGYEFSNCKLAESRKVYAPSINDVKLISDLEVLTNKNNGVLKYTQNTNATNYYSLLRTHKVDKVMAMSVNSSNNFEAIEVDKNTVLNYRPEIRLKGAKVNLVLQEENQTKETYKITYNLTNVSGYNSNAKTINNNGKVTVKFQSFTNYTLPESINVINAKYTWDKATGTLTLSEPIDDIIVSIAGKSLPQEGDLITLNIEGSEKEYRVLTSSGREVTILTNYDISVDNLTTTQRSNIPNYLTHWYEGLSEGKKYILERPFEIYRYAETNDTLCQANTSSSELVSDTLVYSFAPDLSSIKTYCNGTLTTEKINNLFPNNTNGVWLASISSTDSGNGFYVSPDGTIKKDQVTNHHGVRALLTVDLDGLVYNIK